MVINMNNRRLSSYIIPSVISMVIVGTYTNIDGLFIGNTVGDPGLAAINIVWPIVAFITSLGTGIGVGGSVIMSSLRGSGEDKDAERVKGTTLRLLICAGLLIGAIFTLLHRPLLRMMGADGEVFTYAADYALIVSSGAVFQVLGSGLIAILRNEGQTYRAMLYSLLGLVVHILLDMALTSRYLLLGVAVSTVVSQLIIAAACMISLTRHGAGIIRSASRGFVPRILKASAAPLGINFVPSVVLLFTNSFALSVGGVAAVSAYAVMSYAVYTFDYIFQGVCDGAQPVISYCRGSGDIRGQRRAALCAAKVIAVCAIGFSALTPLMICFLPKLFSVSAEAGQMMRRGLMIYSIAYPFKAAAKFICSYFYAVDEQRISSLLIYLDPLLLTPLSLALLTRLGADGLWWSLTATQLILTLASAAALIRRGRKSELI